MLVKNREMIPADIVLLASSNENGSAYIETSSIDGETNLKLRLSPSSYMYGNAETTLTMEDVVSQLNMLTTLGYPNGIAAIESQSISEYSSERRNAETQTEGSQRGSLFRSFRRHSSNMRSIDDVQSIRFVTKLVSETPNASVNTFTGKLIKPNGEEVSTTVPLDADNLLLRGAVLRNTEWVIGVACFTGEDTKVVKNSFATPSKFSQLDEQMNAMIDGVLWFLLFSVLVLAAFAEISHRYFFKTLWYAGYSSNTSPDHNWPYLKDLPAPQWSDSYPNFIQFALTFTTLLPVSQEFFGIDYDLLVMLIYDFSNSLQFFHLLEPCTASTLCDCRNGYQIYDVFGIS